MHRPNLITLLTLALISLARPANAQIPPDYLSLFVHFDQVVGSVHQHKEAIERSTKDYNSPTPEYGKSVSQLRNLLQNDAAILRAIKSDPALRAYHTQVLNHLKHVGFSFVIRDQTYTHDYVLSGPYPFRPTEIAIAKAKDFIQSFYNEETPPVFFPAEDKELERRLQQEQKNLVKKITADPLAVYQDMRNRLLQAGPEAPFPELAPVIQFLVQRLSSDPLVAEMSHSNRIIANFREVVLNSLQRLMTENSYPYLSCIEGIQSATEFFDILARAHDPIRSPQLYHSDRYEYYGHFLKGEIPDHIILPTLVSLGATDILKARGVPIGFIGVNTSITWVDGFYQTPFEFWIHDINHSRRMFQFFKEKADRLGISVEEFAKRSDKFMREKILPLITILPSDSEEAKNKKRLLKVLLFEVFHEDALAAAPDVLKAAVLRPPNLITPFERIDGDVVSYVMEPGATTLAYVFRKLAHDFYDMPGERFDNIVAPKYRTRENIVEVAEVLFTALGFKVNRELLQFYVSTDQGFPRDFKKSIERDLKKRPGETIPLDQESSIGKDNVRAIVAEEFHDMWQFNSGYHERWKIAQAAFKDGRGINDEFRINTPDELTDYLQDQKIPAALHKYFALKVDPASGRLMLFEDIQHLPNKYLAPNLQYENLQGAAAAVDIIDRISERSLHFRNVDQAKNWLKAASQKMNIEWLRRNASWAPSDPNYNRHWRDLAAGKQQNGMILLKIALESELRANSNFLIGSQLTLLKEAIRQVEREIQSRRHLEVRKTATGENIHQNWQKNSGYDERWKPTQARLHDGTLVGSEETLSAYFVERQIPPELRKYYRLAYDPTIQRLAMYEDLQNLPDAMLASNH